MIDAIAFSLPRTISRYDNVMAAVMATVVAPVVVRPAAVERSALADELSEDDLEQVVGGLARVWHQADLAPHAPTPATVARLASTMLPSRQFA